MSGSVLISIKLTARLAGVTDQAVRVAIRRGRLPATTLARTERTAVRGIDLRDAARYYGWPPALVDRLAGEMRKGVPDGKDVHRIDTESDPADAPPLTGPNRQSLEDEWEEPLPPRNERSEQ